MHPFTISRRTFKSNRLGARGERKIASKGNRKEKHN
jgi:hypothetical protein